MAENEVQSAWSSYLAYLVEWAETHKEPEFAGMSPAGYDGGMITNIRKNWI